MNHRRLELRSSGTSRPREKGERRLVSHRNRIQANIRLPRTESANKTKVFSSFRTERGNLWQRKTIVAKFRRRLNHSIVASTRFSLSDSYRRPCASREDFDKILPLATIRNLSLILCDDAIIYREFLSFFAVFSFLFVTRAYERVAKKKTKLCRQVLREVKREDVDSAQI